MSDRVTSDRSATIDSTLQLIKTVWDAAQEGSSRPVEFYEAFPVNSDVNTTPPVITYTDARKIIQPEMRERKMRVREFIDTPDGKIAIFGQRFDHYIAFEVWAESNQEAKDIANTFEDFMFIYLGLFKRMGAVEIQFEDNTLGHVSEPLPAFLENKRSRTLVYKVTIEMLKEYNTSTIDSIILKVGLK